MKKIIICDAILDSGIELLSSCDDVSLIRAEDFDKPLLYKALEDADLAITRSPTAVDEAFLKAGSKLKAIIRAGVGVDNIDLDACSKRGIIVMNIPTANTIAAVELSMAHILCAARSFNEACNRLKIERKWQREDFYGVELKNKVLGLIGCGNIGSRVGLRALAFGMRVFAYDPYISSSRISELGFENEQDFKRLLQISDFISIHTPKTKDTTNIISHEELKLLKNGVRLINCARGGLFNEDAMLKGLKSGKIAWLGIDVFSEEPSVNSPLLELKNVSATSHLGANTVESQEKISAQACEQALNAIRGVSFANALNLPIKAEDINAFTRPFFDLSSKLAFMVSSLHKEPIKAIKIECSGKIAKYINSIESYVLVGALGPFLAENINYINARLIAKEKGIKIKSKEVNISGYSNKISLELITEKSSLCVAGTVFEDDEQRIIAIDDFKTDFKPKGKMIIFKNKDVPGVIAKLSQILATKGVNIADFRLGRDNKGQALAAIIIDQSIDKELLDQLAKIKACVFAKYLEL